MHADSLSLIVREEGLRLVVGPQVHPLYPRSAFLGEVVARVARGVDLGPRPTIVIFPAESWPDAPIEGVDVMLRSDCRGEGVLEALRRLNHAYRWIAHPNAIAALIFAIATCTIEQELRDGILEPHDVSDRFYRLLLGRA